MAGSLEEVARKVAESHLKEDPAIQLVLYAEDADDEEIHLIEVSGAVAEVGEVFPFRYKPQKDVPYPMALVLLHPSDWKKVEDGELELPEEFGSLEGFDELNPRAA